jgi:UPF0176 protein
MSEGLQHLSFYRFYARAACPAQRARVRAFCEGNGLLGTILLAAEGVNGMVEGRAEAIAAFQEFAREEFGLADADQKLLRSPGASFTRLLVKEKKELIPVGDPAIRPHEKTAPRLSPREFRAWLESGKEFTLLDARNTYEVEVGTFRGAAHLNLESSRDFVARAAAEKESWRNRPLLTFCTGGIRCEKASAALLDLGIEEVYQLDGGILRYFAEEGGAHFEGNCFVFDWRGAVDGALAAAPRSAEPGRQFGRHRGP